MDARPPARTVRGGVLRHRRFAVFWLGLLTAHTGVGMQTVGQGWLVYRLTNTPVWLGITALAFALPTIAVPLAIGALADRTDRLALVRAAQVFSAAAVGGLALLTYLGVVQAWHVAVYTLLQGLSLALEGPARHAVIPSLVDRDSLLGAVSLSQSSYQIGGFVGPALAGVLLGAFGTERLYLLFAANACAFLVFAAAITVVRASAGAPVAGPAPAGSVAEGLRYAALLVAFTLARALPTAMALLVAHGFISVTLIASLSAALQLASPDALRGRVMSLWTIANVGLQSAGAMITAGAAALVGAPLAVAGGAVLVTITALALARPLRRLE